MVTNKLKELEAARAKLASLEQSIQSELSKERAQLPAQYGFTSTNDFIDAVRAAAGDAPRRRGRPAGSGANKAATVAKGGKGGPGKKRRPRSVITDETRAQVKKLVEAGKTGAEIA